MTLFSLFVKVSNSLAELNYIAFGVPLKEKKSNLRYGEMIP